VRVTKYRYQALHGDLALRVPDLLRQVCERYEIQMLRGVVSKYHVHILVSAPPDIAPSEIMRRVKGRTSINIFEAFPVEKMRTWGRHFGVRVYFSYTQTYPRHRASQGGPTRPGSSRPSGTFEYAHDCAICSPLGPRHKAIHETTGLTVKRLNAYDDEKRSSANIHAFRRSLPAQLVLSSCR